MCKETDVRPYVLKRTEQWESKSAAGRTYTISLALPKARALESGYPVLYVLDPDTAFATLVDMARNHETMYGPVIVVGVGYPAEADATSRIFDMTPPTDPATLPPFRPGGWGSVGGADAFLGFLRDTLKPEIGGRVPVDEKRQALFGHSLGGLFVLHTLFKHPETFDTYVAGSPAVWWGNKVVLSEMREYKMHQRRTGAPRRLLVTVGQLEATVSPEELRAASIDSIDLYEVRRHSRVVENASSLSAELESLASHGLMTVFARFAEETHTSVIPAYLSRGARFTLSGWFD
jgi:predicted alpha/beta superfamily hydrolase